MWSRVSLKGKARDDLRSNYWKSFVVSLVLIVFGANHNSGLRNGFDYYGNEISKVFMETMFVFSFLFLGTILLIMIWAIVGYLLEVGGRKYYIKLAKGDSNLGNIAFGFREGSSLAIIKTQFLRTIYLILWTLLLIIPGIVKSYAYKMVPYILADNPDIGASRAIELSNSMTDGEKWEMFFLDLSFIGWFLLGVLTFGIGWFFVQPYYDATYGELYLILREKALDLGLTTKEELNIFHE